MIYIASFLAFLLLCFDANATWLVLTAKLLEPSRQLMQILIVWLLPVFGAVMVSCLYDEATYEYKNAKPFTDGGFAEPASWVAHHHPPGGPCGW